MAAGATPADIRNAYRALARTHHPDQRPADEPASAAVSSTSMAELNEAYRVLRDPLRRSRYDDELRRRSTSAARTTFRTDRTRASTTTYAPVNSAASGPAPDRSPARYPWKLVSGMAAVGAAIVLAGTALYEPAGPEVPDNVLRPGSCVVVEANNDAREVTCDGDSDDLIVRELIPLDRSCPQGLSAYRDRQGMGMACVSSDPILPHNDSAPG